MNPVKILFRLILIGAFAYGMGVIAIKVKDSEKKWSAVYKNLQENVDPVKVRVTAKKVVTRKRRGPGSGGNAYFIHYIPVDNPPADGTVYSEGVRPSDYERFHVGDIVEAHIEGKHHLLVGRDLSSEAFRGWPVFLVGLMLAMVYLKWRWSRSVKAE